MASHSSALACRIPWTEEPGGLQSMGRKESDRLSDLTNFRFPDSLFGVFPSVVRNFRKNFKESFKT